MIDLSNYSIIEIYLYFFKNVGGLNLNLYKGVFYITLHMLYGILILLSLLFVKNINYLFIVFIIICINCFVIYKFRRCPLAELERHNINFSSIDTIFNSFYKFFNINIQDKNNIQNKKNVCFKHLKVHNIDEVSLENLIICATSIACKIFILMLIESLFRK
jgi:hypothetical protein